MNKPHYLLYCLSLLAAIFIFEPEIVHAQNSTSSPYSMYGLGELRSQTNARNAGLGNAGIALSSNSFLNALNPASYQGIDSLNFILEMGVDGKYSNFKSQGKSANLSDANFSYLAMGWRINQWIAAGIGVNPFSSTGYEINTTALVDGIPAEYPLSIAGSGDISRAYASVSLVPVKNLALGVKTSYLFGSLNQTQYHNLAYIGSNAITNETTDYFHNFYWEFGLQYTFQVKSNTFTLGAIYNPGQSLVTERENSTYNSAGAIFENTTESKDDFIIPEEFGVGLAFNNNKNLLYVLDAGLQKWSDYSYDLSGVRLKNNPYVRTGIEYTPTTNFLADFHKRVNYRLGFQYAKSYLDLRNNQLDETSISLGFGLPIRNQRSRVDVSFEAGQKGTTVNRLIKENFFRVRVGFSLRDLWFQHRQFN
ncbi:MAG: hypothetical protein AB7U05_01985 [Mangrovibacterium sp.]